VGVAERVSISPDLEEMPLATKMEEGGRLDRGKDFPGISELGVQSSSRCGSQGWALVKQEFISTTPCPQTICMPWPHICANIPPLHLPDRSVTRGRSHPGPLWVPTGVAGAREFSLLIEQDRNLEGMGE
jgi:hypothetical protein